MPLEAYWNTKHVDQPTRIYPPHVAGYLLGRPIFAFYPHSESWFSTLELVAMQHVEDEKLIIELAIRVNE